MSQYREVTDVPVRRVARCSSEGFPPTSGVIEMMLFGAQHRFAYELPAHRSLVNVRLDESDNVVALRDTRSSEWRLAQPYKR